MLYLFKYVAAPIVFILLLSYATSVKEVFAYIVIYLILQLALNYFEAKNIKYNAGK